MGSVTSVTCEATLLATQTVVSESVLREMIVFLADQLTGL